MRNAAVLMLFLFAGCSTQDLVLKRVGELPPDTAPAYRAGYGDGCYTVVRETCSATGRGPIRRDVTLMKTDREYALGWTDGSRACSCAGTAYMYIPLTSD